MIDSKQISSSLDALARVLFAPHSADGPAYPVYADTNGNLRITQGGMSAVVSGSQTVATTGSAIQLTTVSTTCLCVDISADTNNADVVVVGGSGVVAAGGSQKGLVLFAGNPATRIYIDDVSKLYVDAASNGDKVAFNYYV